MFLRNFFGISLVFVSLSLVGRFAHSQTDIHFVPRSGFWNDGTLANAVFIKFQTAGKISSLLTPLQREQINELQEEFNLITRSADEHSRVDPQSSAVAQHKRIEMAPQFLERMEAIVGDDIWPLVVLEMNRTIATHYEDPSGLTIPSIVEGLKLNSRQTREFQELKERLDFFTEKHETDLEEKFKSLLERHFLMVKSELELPQSKQFLAWFGQLNCFETIALTDQYRSIITEVSEQAELGSIAGIQMEETADSFHKRVEGLPIAKRRDVEIDLLFYRVLTMDSVESDLMLTAEQAKLIKNELQGDEIRLVLRNRRTQRLLAILEDKWELPTWLDKILLDHQKDWFRQFEFQVYCLAYADSFGILHPDVSKALKLMPHQKIKIEKLADDYGIKVRDLSLEVGRSIEMKRQEMHSKMLKSLTPEQLHQYTLWFGATGVQSENGD